MRKQKKINIENLCKDMDRYINQMEASKKPISNITLSETQYKAYVNANMGMPEYRGIPLQYQ